MIGLILAAGSGKRLGETFGKAVCKPLLKIAGKHLIEYSLENLFNLDVERIYIVVGSQKESVENAVTSEYKGIPVYYVVQEKPVGLVNAIAAAAEKTDGDTVLQLSDEILVNIPFDEVRKIKDEKGVDFICGITYENDEEKIKKNYSVETDKDGRIICCNEKPQIVKNNIKGTGFCVFSRECMKLLFEKYDSEKNIPRDLCDFINLLTEEGYRGQAVEIAAKEYNINTVDDARIASAELNGGGGAL